MAKLSLRPSIMKRFNLPFLSMVVAALVLLLTSADSSAQTDQGAITGVVQDSTGAVIPNAQVTATNIDTGLALQAKSNSSGVARWGSRHWRTKSSNRLWSPS